MISTTDLRPPTSSGAVLLPSDAQSWSRPVQRAVAQDRAAATRTRAQRRHTAVLEARAELARAQKDVMRATAALDEASTLALISDLADASDADLDLDAGTDLDAGPHPDGGPLDECAVPLAPTDLGRRMVPVPGGAD